MEMSKERFRCFCYLTKASPLVKSGIKMQVFLMQTSCSSLLHGTLFQYLVKVLKGWGPWFLLSTLWWVGGWERYGSSQLRGTHGENLVSLAPFTGCPWARAPALLVAHWDSSPQLFSHDALESVPVAISRNIPAPPHPISSPLSWGSLSLRVSSRT